MTLRINGRAGAVALSLAFLVGCSSGPAAVPLATESVPLASDTPAATPIVAPKATAKPTPKPTAKPTPRPTPRATPKPASFYKPPDWDGSSDVNCPDFDTQAHAESFFKGTGGTTTYDPYGLDHDHDGIACESLP